MSQHTFRPLLGSLDLALVTSDGYVALGSDGYLVASAFNGSTNSLRGWTVARTGVGEFTFTLLDPCYAVKFVACTFVSATAKDLIAQVKSFSNSSVVVRLLTGATPTDTNVASGLLFHCMCTNSSSTR